MDKNYGLTNQYGNNIKDAVPSWMDEVFNRKQQKKENPFKDIDNFLNIGLKEKK